MPQSMKAHNARALGEEARIMRKFFDGAEWWLAQPASNANAFMIALLVVGLHSCMAH